MIRLEELSDGDVVGKGVRATGKQTSWPNLTAWGRGDRDNDACRRYSLRRHRMGVAGRARGAALTARRIPLIPYAALLRFFGGAMRVGGAPSSKEAALSQTCASCM